MAAEKLNRMDVLETNLRRVIAMRPTHAHAYNALGYSLADRNERLAEARTLIETAHRLAPEDSYILDSLGWVLFRRGRVAQALPVLERAWTLSRDAEIGAHFGEVLWKRGEEGRARYVWQQAANADPANALLDATRQRLTGEAPEAR
jgi:Flp pilus assembly protein TadD